MGKLKDVIDKKRKELSNKDKMFSCIDRAIHHTENKEPFKAYDEYKELLELAEEEDDFQMILKAHRQLGECMLELQRPLDALKHIQNYLKISSKLKDHFETQRAHVTIGRCYLHYSLSLRKENLKKLALLKSEDAFIKSLHICQSLADGTLNSNLSNNSNSKSNSDLRRELIEMRAISFYNLGMVNREKSASRYDVSEKFFSQCSNICSKHKLWDLFLNSIFQLLEIKYYQTLENQSLSNLNFKFIEDGLNIIKNGFKQMEDVSFTSSMKKNKKDIQELEAQCFVLSGKLLKAAKKYRNLSKRSIKNHEKYENQMLHAVNLNKKLSNYHENRASFKDEIFIGKLYEELNVHHLAAKHYNLALKKNKENESLEFLKLSNNLIVVNQLINHHQENIWLLKNKIKLLMKNNVHDSSSANACCRVMEQLLDSWLQSGTGENQINEILEVIQQLDSLSIIADNHAIKVSVNKTIISICEELKSQTLEKELTKSRLKLEQLETMRNDSLECDECETEEQMLSEIELSDTEIDILSSDSDVDLLLLNDEQLEELKAVGKRVNSGANKSFIKRNEKGETLLHVAAINGKFKQVEKLVNQLNHPLDIVDSAGWTPLHDAANHGNKIIVEFLLDRGANLEHTGPSIDCSTPLMEAVHGGNIDIAIMLIKRGANLWHKNRENKNLGDCIDEWRARCRINHSFNEPEAYAYQEIMYLIKEKLAEKYIQWCRERKGNSVDSSNQNKKKNESQSKEMTIHDRRKLNYDDFITSESDENSKDAVQDYLTAIRGVKRCKKKISEENSNSTSQEAGYVIGDDWLENDVPTNTSKRKKIQEPDYGGYVRNNYKRKAFVDKENTRTPYKSILKKRSTELIIDNQRENLFYEYNEIGTDSTTELSQYEEKSKSLENIVINSVAVSYRSISMIIPITVDCTVKWLSEETARRYSLLVPTDSVQPCVNIKIMNENGDFLLETDRFLDVIGNFGPAPIKLIATDASIINRSTSISSKFQKIYQSIQPALMNHILNLSDYQLGQDLPDCLYFFHCTLNLRSFSKIILKNNLINDDLITKPYSTQNYDADYDYAEPFDFLRIIHYYHGTTLVELDLSDNKITGNGFSNLLQSLKVKPVLCLKILNLSSNPIGVNNFCVVSLIIKPILLVFPAIEKLILKDCEISNFSEFPSMRNQERLDPVLHELDLSNNPLNFKLENLNSNFWKFVGPCLQNLTLHGCGQFLENLDINRSLVTEFISNVVELLISIPLLKMKSVDLSDCSLDCECIHQLSRLFTNKNLTLSYLICHSNNVLKHSIENWCALVHDLNQPLCRITKLSIDMPLVTNLTDYEICLYTIQEKIRSRIGFKLSVLYFRIDSETINHVKHGLFEHGLNRLDDDSIRLPDDAENEMQTIHYCKCFILSVVETFRNRDGIDNVRIEFEDNFLKIIGCLEK